MANNKFESTWKILEESNFVLINEVSKEMICVICQKLIANASIGPCGCRYCLKCITNYLQDNDKYCPGKSSDCLENQLNLICDIHSDYALNISITKLIVKCAVKNCKFTTELRHMENHLRQCDLNKTDCSFNDIGRDLSNLSPAECELLSQSKFLLQSFDNLKNENEAVKKDLINCVTKVELNKNDNEMKMNALRIELEGLNCEIVALKNDNRMLTEEIEILKNNDEINKMNQIIERTQRIVTQQTREINQMKQKWKSLEHSQIEKKDVIFKSRFGINDLEIQEEDTNIQSPFEEIPEEIISYGKFEWKIEKFSKFESNTWIYSEPFFTHENGFKICLWMKNNISSLDSSLSFMQGEFDDDLSWPFKHGFTIELVNSLYSNIYKEKTITYNDDPGNDGWKKPVDHSCKLISYFNNIRLNNSLINNDCITIRCLFIPITSP